MTRDITWKEYFLDNERYADIINAVGCGGKQVVTKDDLQELDTQTGFIMNLALARKIRKIAGQNRNVKMDIGTKSVRKKIKIRDMLRKAAFGVNFAIIGIEHQETPDYAIPLRSMSYDVGEYEKQAARIRKEVRKNHKGLTAGEYMYGFRKDSRLKPVVTFILYSGTEEWNGLKTLHDMLDFTDIPAELKKITPDYRINLINIRKLKDTSVFKTDVRHVFDFIRCSENRDKLKELVDSDDYYKNMEEDAYDVVAHYTKAEELIEAKDYYGGKDGKVDMCRAIKELIEEGREEGRLEERIEVMTATALRMLAVGKYAIDEIADISGLPINDVNKLSKKSLGK
ncbi:MAG: Rpn family recombination-promoting nuclease/putative transposase [Ruminococcus flavefaciens]|nr:Rpn family recombination-promoting nuclease/putative transposase [Ruminococcus flavefaciens]